MTETITGVALMSSDGRCVALPRPSRHHNLFALLALMNDDFEPNAVQGFMTSEGRFLRRKQALELVQSNGQTRRNPNPEHELYSEDLW